MKKTIVAFAAALITLAGCLAAQAQATFKVEFSTSFSFYAGKTKLPAGSYVITQSQVDQTLYTIQNTSTSHSVMAAGRQTSKTASGAPEIVFNRYGSTEYLEEVLTSAGNSIALDTGAPEKADAKKGAPQSHTVQGK